MLGVKGCVFAVIYPLSVFINATALLYVLFVRLFVLALTGFVSIVSILHSNL